MEVSPPRLAPPLTRASVGRSTLLLLAVGFVALAAIGGTSVWLVGRTRAHGEALAAAEAERRGLVLVTTQLRAAESGQRGFLLTGDPSYLEPYRRTVAAIPGTLAALDGLAATDPAAPVGRARLRGLAEAKMAELARTVALTEEGRREEALALVRSDRGRDLMEEARDLVVALVAGIDARIDRSTADLASSGRALLAVAAVGGLLILAVAAGAVRVASRYTRELEAARGALGEANAGLEDRVRERVEELGAANEEIQRFAYIVSHDLRAPLVNVMGFTAELEIALGPLQALVAAAEAEAPGLLTAEARAAAREDLPEAVSFIRSSTERMDRLINAILRLSREGRRTLRPERVRMGELLQGAGAAVRHQLEEAGAEFRVEGTVPDLVSDRLALEQVFGNLVENAVKYLDRGRPGVVVVRGRAEGARAVYEVEDNGRGIADRDLQRIFELFRRAGPQDRPGEGIGLAHVRALARRLGGNIACRSEPGRGSVFVVSLPRTLRRAADGAAASAGATGADAHEGAAA